MNPTRALAGAALAALSILVLAAFAAVAEARTVYVANNASGTVSALRIAADGSLSPVAGSPFAATPFPAGLSIAPDGSTLVAARREMAGALAAFTPAPDGGLTPKAGTAPATGSIPIYTTVEPTGRFAYAVNNTGAPTRNVSGFALAGGGMPTSLGAPFAAPGVALLGVAASPDGRFVYVGTGPASGLAGYSIGTDGLLSPLPGSPFVIESANPQGMVASPDGRFLFVGDATENQIVTISVSANGIPSKIDATDLPGGSQSPANLAITPDGRYLYSANQDDTDRSISTYAVADNGSLVAVGVPIPTAAPPSGIAVTPDGRRLYVALASGGANILGFAIGAGGVLSTLPGSPYPSGGLNTANSADQLLAIAPNQGPRAVFTAKAAGPGSRTVVFDGSGSTDSDGRVAAYEWDFGDGQTATSTAATVEHAYAKDGTYEAKLRVVDDEGCSTARIYTGQATLCNGGSAAAAAVAVTVPGPNDKGPEVSGIKVTKKLSKGKLARLTVTFRLSKAATARVEIQRKAAGRKVGGRCVKPKRANRGKRKCPRWVAVLSRSVRADKAGPMELRLGKKVAGRLKPGGYRVAVTARDAAGQRTANAATKQFAVAKPKRRP